MLLWHRVYVALLDFFLKKYFVGMEKGCIFASAFVKKNGLLKNSDESERNLKRMRRKR